MAAQAHQLLGEVEAVGGDHDLLVQARLVEGPPPARALRAPAQALAHRRVHVARAGSRRPRAPPPGRGARAGRARGPCPPRRAWRRARQRRVDAPRAAPRAAPRRAARARRSSPRRAARARSATSSSPATPSPRGAPRPRAGTVRRGEVHSRLAAGPPPGDVTARSNLPRANRALQRGAHSASMQREGRGRRIRASRKRWFTERISTSKRDPSTSKSRAAEPRHAADHDAPWAAPSVAGSSSRTSSRLAVAVPTLPTTTPAAAFAITAASSSVAPARNASARAAMLVRRRPARRRPRAPAWAPRAPPSVSKTLMPSAPARDHDRAAADPSPQPGDRPHQVGARADRDPRERLGFAQVGLEQGRAAEGRHARLGIDHHGKAAARKRRMAPMTMRSRARPCRSPRARRHRIRGQALDGAHNRAPGRRAAVERLAIEADDLLERATTRVLRVVARPGATTSRPDPCRGS